MHHALCAAYMSCSNVMIYSHDMQAMTVFTTHVFACCRGQLPASLGGLSMLNTLIVQSSGLAAGTAQNSRKQYLPAWLQFDA